MGKHTHPISPKCLPLGIYLQFLCFSLLWFCLLFSLFTPPSPCELGDVDAVKVVGSEGTVALWALSLSGVVTHLQTFVAEYVETLGEHRLLVSCVAAGAAQLGLETDKQIVFVPNTDFPTRLLPLSIVCYH